MRSAVASSIAPLGFTAYFRLATGGATPYPYQRRLAEGATLPAVLDIPTGLGKTLAVVLAWHWRRHQPATRATTPRRLVFCLPMRVLVKQTAQAIETAMVRLAAEGHPRATVQTLMGGQIDSDWQEHPEADTILIGTQDQLLSRALNRGYAMSRHAWPIHFAWLNNDCLWVVDETQLMGPGLETSAQLAGLRQKLTTYGPAGTVWMSATLDKGALQTFDHRPVGEPFALDAVDLASEQVQKRVTASKALTSCPVALSKVEAKGYAQALARFIRETHRPGTLTLVVLNRVARAQAVFEALRAQKLPDTQLGLVHSRMRPHDRAAQEAVLLASDGDRIVIATQAVEAGVDVSAETLVTELAPWASLVQRFGRCNRYGEQPTARAFWIDVEPDKDLCLPYIPDELAAGRERLSALTDAGPNSLKAIVPPASEVTPHGFRRRDLLDLFDTTSDLLGADLDVSRYIRESDDVDVQVFWRELGSDGPPVDLPGPQRDELVAVSVAAMRKLVDAPGTRAWWWSDDDGAWLRQPDGRSLRPGQALLLDRAGGGYDDQLGWTGKATDLPSLVPLTSPLRPMEGLAGDRDAARGTRSWVSLAAHTDDVVAQVEALRDAVATDLPALPWEVLGRAARRHDWGKAHDAFQSMLGPPADLGPPGALWAKSAGAGGRRTYVDKQGHARPGFRHELASGLAYLACCGDEPDADLVAYLIVAHHGKVRVNLRATPGETEAMAALGPDAPPRFARGVWEGDELPAADLGGGVQTTALTLSLDALEMGTGSWLGRVLRVRDGEAGPVAGASAALGPFRLAYLEALFRVADWRGSAARSEGGSDA